MTLEIILFFITLLAISGMSRALVGSGKTSRWLTYPPVATIVAISSFGVTVPALIVAVACLTMGLGYTEWYDKKYMLVRYGIAPLLATLVLVSVFAVSPVLYVWPIASAIVGWFYGDLKDVTAYLGWHDQVAEFIAGAIGIGLAAIGLFI